MAHKIQQIALFLDPSPGYMADVVMGVQEFARTGRAWSVEVCHSLPIATASTASWKPDGVLVNCSDGEWGPLLRSLDVPTVQVGGQLTPGFPRVLTDNGAIGAMAARHFLERGFRRFAFFGYGFLGWSNERGQAFTDALAKDGHTCEWFRAEPGQIHTHHVTGLIADWVKSLPKPVALFACHDRAAMLLGHACAYLGCDVPGDVALLGVDNNPLECGFTTPPLSSVMGSARRIGYQAAALLDQMLRDGTRSVPADFTQLVAPAGVAVRQSTDAFGSDDPDLVAALHFIRDHAHEPIDVSDVATAAIVTRRMLERKFRAALNRSPRQHILWAHIEQAKKLLINTGQSMLEVSDGSGFPSRSKFSAVFKRETGLTPVAFRKLYGSTAATPLRS